jgi:hypothetical protein
MLFCLRIRRLQVQVLPDAPHYQRLTKVNSGRKGRSSHKSSHTRDHFSTNLLTDSDPRVPAGGGRAARQWTRLAGRHGPEFLCTGAVRRDIQLIAAWRVPVDCSVRDGSRQRRQLLQVEVDGVPPHWLTGEGPQMSWLPAGKLAWESIKPTSVPRSQTRNTDASK